MKVNFDDIEDFMGFIPVLINLAIQNNEYLPDMAAEYFDDVSKKIKNVTRQYFIANPDLRLKLKRMLKGFENNQNVVLTIKGGGNDAITTKENSDTIERKYLTESSWVPMIETIKKYL